MEGVGTECALAASSLGRTAGLYDADSWRERAVAAGSGSKLTMLVATRRGAVAMIGMIMNSPSESSHCGCDENVTLGRAARDGGLPPCMARRLVTISLSISMWGSEVAAATVALPPVILLAVCSRALRRRSLFR